MICLIWKNEKIRLSDHFISIFQYIKGLRMAFVNEYISPEDREFYQLTAFDNRIPSSNPQDSWAIDRERNIFLRVIRTEARKNEPGDPEARYEKDFHYYWKGYSYVVQSRKTREQEFRGYQGEIIDNNPLVVPNSERLLFRIHHIGEVSKPSVNASSALQKNRMDILENLQEALAISYGGLCSYLTPEENEQPRHALLNIAPHAEVV